MRFTVHRPVPRVRFRGLAVSCLLLLCLSAWFGCAPPERRFVEELMSPWVGKAAPELRGTMLDGSPFDLDEKSSQQVIMLDFWATWCGPCVMELPVLMQIADEYRSRGVELYAVNVEEDPAAIRGFLDEQGWKLNVVLDPQGKHSSAYEVNGIPHLVLIGKGGIIRQVHVGLAPDMEQRLRRELDEILAGTGKSS